LAARSDVARGWAFAEREVSLDSLTLPPRTPDARAGGRGRVPGDLMLPMPTGWSDGLTDTDGPRVWDRLIAAEQARNVRHGRTGTIVLVEIVGMRDAVERWGTAVALQHFVQLARIVARDIRKSDHIARIQPSRFGVLLTETDEISTINFVDRLRERSRESSETATTGLRIAVGWASPPKGGSLEDAMTVAEQRLVVELSRET
jgi:diguanylate cyclase (GGDEF)-like protein